MFSEKKKSLKSKISLLECLMAILIAISILFLSPSCGKEEPIMNEPEPVSSVNQKDISEMSNDEIRKMQKQADEDFYQAAMENAPVVEVNTNIDELFKI